MNGLRFLSKGLTIAILAGCTGPQVATLPQRAIAPQALHHSASWMLPEAKGKTLVYVTNWKLPYVYAYAYPSGSLEGTLKLSGYIHNICSDDHGDVWIPVNVNSSRGLIFKYKHGGTKPIKTLSDSEIPLGCAVDESTGDLAVIGNFYEGSYYYGGVAIYPGGRGKPTYHSLSYGPDSCTYDSSGDLFVGLEWYISSWEYELLWLQKGASGFKAFSLRPYVTPYAVRWDGSDLAISAGNGTIDRFEIEGRAGNKVGAAHLVGKRTEWWISDARVFGTYEDSFVVWRYPKGGKPLETIDGPPSTSLHGITVSNK